jgi:hypothetical protein
MSESNVVLQNDDGEVLFLQPAPTSMQSISYEVPVIESDYVLPELHGTKTLVLVPGNERKRELAHNWARVKLGISEDQLVVQRVTGEKVKSDIEQPYNKQGLECGVKRVIGTLAWLSENESVLKSGIGRVLVVAVENFIDDIHQAIAVDYGMLMVYDVLTGVCNLVVSQGVGVQVNFLREACKEGFVNDDLNCGKVTYGSVLANHFDCVDGADWHMVVCGRSRFDILAEALECVSCF